MIRRKHRRNKIPNANGAAPKRTKVSGSLTNLYDVKGCISGEYLWLRVKALNADAATKLAHDRNMTVHQCVEVKTNRQDRQTYPRDGGTGFGKGRTRDTV